MKLNNLVYISIVALFGCKQNSLYRSQSKHFYNEEKIVKNAKKYLKKHNINIDDDKTCDKINKELISKIHHFYSKKYNFAYIPALTGIFYRYYKGITPEEIKLLFKNKGWESEKSIEELLYADDFNISYKNKINITCNNTKLKWCENIFEILFYKEIICTSALLDKILYDEALFSKFYYSGYINSKNAKLWKSINACKFLFGHESLMKETISTLPAIIYYIYTPNDKKMQVAIEETFDTNQIIKIISMMIVYISKYKNKYTTFPYKIDLDKLIKEYYNYRNYIRNSLSKLDSQAYELTCILNKTKYLNTLATVSNSRLFNKSTISSIK